MIEPLEARRLFAASVTVAGPDFTGNHDYEADLVFPAFGMTLVSAEIAVQMHAEQEWVLKGFDFTFDSVANYWMEVTGPGFTFNFHTVIENHFAYEGLVDTFVFVENPPEFAATYIVPAEQLSEGFTVHVRQWSHHAANFSGQISQVWLESNVPAVAALTYSAQDGEWGEEFHEPEEVIRLIFLLDDGSHVARRTEVARRGVQLEAEDALDGAVGLLLDDGVLVSHFCLSDSGAWVTPSSVSGTTASTLPILRG